MILSSKTTNRDRTDFFYGIIIIMLGFFCLAILFLVKPLFDGLADAPRYINTLIYTTILIFLLYLYARLFPLIKTAGISARGMLMIAIFLSILALCVWPSTSTDIFNYISFSRVSVIYGENPYLTPYSHYPHDSLYPALYNVWSVKTSIYGPLFTYISDGLAFLGGGSIFLNILFYKIVFAAAFVGSSWLVYKIGGDIRAMYLFAFNPFLLSEFLVNLHNDLLMIFFFLLALFFLLKKHNEFRSLMLAWFFLVLSFLVKYFTLLFFPLFFVYILKRAKGARKKIFIAVALPVLTVLLTLFTFWPFWQGPSMFNDLSVLVSLKTSIFVSPLILALAQFGKWFNVDHYFTTGRDISRTLFVLLYAFFASRVILKKTSEGMSISMLHAALWIYALFLLMFFTWLMPWYFTTLIAIAAVCLGLSDRKEYRYFVFLSSFYGAALFLNFIT